MYVQRSSLLCILSLPSFSVYLAMCWQKHPISFTVNFTEEVGACAYSVYQALSPPLKGPGDEVNNRFLMSRITQFGSQVADCSYRYMYM